MADSPTVVVVGGSTPQPEPEPEPRQEPEPDERAIQLGAVLESNRQLNETVQAQAMRLEAMEARDRERGAQFDALMSRLTEREEEPEEETDVELITPEPEPAPAEPEPEPEKKAKDCPRWMKIFLAEK